ncbi:hypothetical protein EIO_0736 [Ketogulonicigenium vulgare Y25]|nr:hypothetical protein EIO_0736 [Ketogulonicigenium vulgare Y25]AOZ53814.1 hypothetical protein KVC_0797 [Ketogulonicigenium vulgare]
MTHGAEMAGAVTGHKAEHRPRNATCVNVLFNGGKSLIEWCHTSLLDM